MGGVKMVRRLSGVRVVLAGWVHQRRRELLCEGLDAGRWSAETARVADALVDRPEIEPTDDAWVDFVDDLAPTIDRASGPRLRIHKAAPLVKQKKLPGHSI